MAQEDSALGGGSTSKALGKPVNLPPQTLNFLLILNRNQNFLQKRINSYGMIVYFT